MTAQFFRLNGMAEKNRIFVGGLFPEVTEKELIERFAKFGKVDSVEIKIRRDDTGAPIKTFAYVDGHFVENDLKKCFSIYNNSKWKGNVLKLQLAKESFREKLKCEIESKDVNEAHSTDSAVPMTCRREVQKAVPGTALEGEKEPEQMSIKMEFFSKFPHTRGQALLLATVHTQ